MKKYSKYNDGTAINLLANYIFTTILLVIIKNQVTQMFFLVL